MLVEAVEALIGVGATEFAGQVAGGLPVEAAERDPLDGASAFGLAEEGAHGIVAAALVVAQAEQEEQAAAVE